MNPIKFVVLVISIIIICCICSMCAFLITYSTEPNSTNNNLLDICISGGKAYNIGDSYFDGCNSCICGQNGESACTKKYCEDSQNTTNTENSSKEPVCWNRAKNVDGVIAWPDGCKGITCSKQAVSLCTSAIEPLSELETGIYKTWMSTDVKDIPEDCKCYN